jgi:hypothetical protein
VDTVFEFLLSFPDLADIVKTSEQKNNNKNKLSKIMKKLCFPFNLSFKVTK